MIRKIKDYNIVINLECKMFIKFKIYEIGLY